MLCKYPCYNQHLRWATNTLFILKRGFYTIMSAQFFSSLADNALFVAAVELLRASNSPEWQRAALVPMFAFFYVALAPFVGAFADALPKGKVMFISNAIKVVGCLMMLFGSHPLMAYAVVGLGAAAYSPAKYGILTELLPASQLVKANGWIEGLTIGSIILGVLLGGQLVGHSVSHLLLSFDFPVFQTGIDTAPEAAICILVVVYMVAAWFNTRIPHTGVEMRPMPKQLLSLLPDFWQCNTTLWKDKLGQISLAMTTLFWGVSGNLRYIVLAWSAAALGYSTTQASSLVGVVAIGTAAGAILASMKMKLEHATKVIPMGIAMGLLMIVLNVIDNVWVAAPFLIVLGAIGGFLVVPMNALLQHRGHNLMGAGRSIAVQNFNEQACILALGAFYTVVASIHWAELPMAATLGLDEYESESLSAYLAIAIFGLLVAGVMWVIKRWHASNQIKHKAELERLLAIARNDNLHG
jgi:MFS transporter, LPLT family, lysophospholipid transporter